MLSSKYWIWRVTGIMLALFLIQHLGINMTSLTSRETYESTWEFIKGNSFSKILTVVLACSSLIHIIYSIILAVGEIKDSKKKHQEKIRLRNLWKTLISLGGIIVGLLAIHLSHFWAKIQVQGENPYDISRTLFYNGLYVSVYVIWIIALYYYLSYGFWNLFQPASIKKNKSTGPLQTASRLFAFLITGGFMIILVYFYLDLGYE